ncbi:MAG: hypothetical protein ACYCPS_00065 [Candidatus Saccharimonadales bacterium]
MNIQGSEAEVSPLQGSNFGEPISGRISGFNLSRATLSIRAGLQIADLIAVKFCAIEFNAETQTLSTTELIEWPLISLPYSS